jgi:hypothetical protein
VPPVLSQAQIDGRACVRCGAEDTLRRSYGQYGDQTANASECIDAGQCQMQRVKIDQFRALDELAARRNRGSRGR